MTGREPDTTRLAAAAPAVGEPTGWFERLYAEAGETLIRRWRTEFSARG
jgi:hypothetical protein